MSSGDPHDEQVQSKNRSDDTKYAKIQADRNSDIAKGFSHNTDALRAYYGISPRVRAYPAGYEFELRDELRSRMQRILAALGDWADSTRYPNLWHFADIAQRWLS